MYSLISFPTNIMNFYIRYELSFFSLIFCDTANICHLIQKSRNETMLSCDIPTSWAVYCASVISAYPFPEVCLEYKAQGFGYSAVD